MTFLEIARRWTIAILAETLRTSASAIEAVLPFQPRWLAQIALLASQLRAAADKDDSRTEEDGAPETVELPSIEVLLASHTCLRQGLSDIAARGLALDDDLLQRMKTDWSLDSVVSYLRSAENALRENAGRTLDEAAGSLGVNIAAKTTIAGCDLPVAVPVQVVSKGASKSAPAPVRRSVSAR